MSILFNKNTKTENLIIKNYETPNSIYLDYIEETTTAMNAFYIADIMLETTYSTDSNLSILTENTKVAWYKKIGEAIKKFWNSLLAWLKKQRDAFSKWFKGIFKKNSPKDIDKDVKEEEELLKDIADNKSSNSSEKQTSTGLIVYNKPTQREGPNLDGPQPFTFKTRLDIHGLVNNKDIFNRLLNNIEEKLKSVERIGDRTINNTIDQLTDANTEDGVVDASDNDVDLFNLSAIYGGDEREIRSLLGGHFEFFKQTEEEYVYIEVADLFKDLLFMGSEIDNLYIRFISTVTKIRDNIVKSNEQITKQLTEGKIDDIRALKNNEFRHREVQKGINVLIGVLEKNKVKTTQFLQEINRIRGEHKQYMRELKSQL